MSTHQHPVHPRPAVLGAGRPARLALAAVAVAVALTACASGSPAPVVGGPTSTGPSSTGPSSTGPSSTSPGSTASSPAATALTVEVTIAGDDVTPNGEKLDVAVGQQVVLEVTSDVADEIHAHTGGDGFELEVAPGETSTGSFTLDSAGSFEVESHHSGKVIVILNAR